MSDVVRIECEHQGRRRRDGGGAPVVIARWGRDAPYAWTALWEEHAATLPLSAQADHERTVMLDDRADDRRVDGQDRVRLRGGITETRRGWELTCGRCGLSVRPRHRTVMDALEQAHREGRAAVTLAGLNTPAR